MGSLADVFRPVLELHFLDERMRSREDLHVALCACATSFKAPDDETVRKLWAAHVADELLAVTRGTAEAFGIRRRG